MTISCWGRWYFSFIFIPTIRYCSTFSNSVPLQWHPMFERARWRSIDLLYYQCLRPQSPKSSKTSVTCYLQHQSPVIIASSTTVAWHYLHQSPVVTYSGIHLPSSTMSVPVLVYNVSPLTLSTTSVKPALGTVKPDSGTVKPLPVQLHLVQSNLLIQLYLLKPAVGTVNLLTCLHTDRSHVQSNLPLV